MRQRVATGDLFAELDRPAKLRALDRLALPGATRRQTRNVRELLRRLEMLDSGRLAERQRSIVELAYFLEWSRNTVLRTVHLAESHGLLDVTRRRDPRTKAQLENEYAVNWPAIRRLAERKPATDPRGDPPLPQGETPRKPPCQNGTTQSQNGTPPVPKWDSHKEDPVLSCTTSLRSSTLPLLTREWTGVVGDLLKRGVGGAEPACRKAIDAGASVEDVLRLIAHWDARPGAWGEGALYLRIVRQRPGLPIDAAWDPMRPGWEARQRQAAQAASGGQLERSAAEARRRQADDVARRRDLERRHGAALDAMDREQIAGLADRLGPALRAAAAQFGPAAVRPDLLELLEVDPCQFPSPSSSPFPPPAPSPAAAGSASART